MSWLCARRDFQKPDFTPDYRPKICRIKARFVPLHRDMIEVEVQKVTFRKTKAYLLARKSIALEMQNGTSGE